jgi:hypothetical protein
VVVRKEGRIIVHSFGVGVVICRSGSNLVINTLVSLFRRTYSGVIKCIQGLFLSPRIVRLSE